MTKPMLIGLLGAAKAGKSYTANILVSNHGYRRLSMARPLKDMLKAIGLTEEHVNGSLKFTPTGILCEQTPRHAMQTLGTEWGRDCIDPYIWVNLMELKIHEAHSAGVPVVIDDIRFPNEIEMIGNLGGELWLIRRPAVEPMLPPWWKFWAPKLHWSERHLAQIIAGKSEYERCVTDTLWNPDDDNGASIRRHISKAFKG